MITIFNKTKMLLLLVIVSAALTFVSCNKELTQYPATPAVAPSGLALGEKIAATATDSLYYRLIIKSGLLPSINNKATSFTMFVPDNTGMKVFINAISGGLVPLAAPDAVFSAFITANIPAASAAGIVLYNLIPQTYTTGSILTSFPNMQMPTGIILDPTNALVRMTNFPSKRGSQLWLNNIPLTGPNDVAVANGVIHHTFTVAAPPQTTLRAPMYAEPTLTYFKAAIARADSGAVGLGKLDSLLNYGVTNMTILAPNDVAFQTLLTGVITGALIAQGVPPATAAATAAALASTPAVFSNPALYGSLTAATVKGILVYHFLATQAFGAYTPNGRAFSVNFAPAPGAFFQTLVNTAFAAHPGIRAQATFAGPFVSGIQFTGLGTFPPGGAPYSGASANAVKMDQHAVNGVYHIIDRVLLPQ